MCMITPYPISLHSLFFFRANFFFWGIEIMYFNINYFLSKIIQKADHEDQKLLFPNTRLSFISQRQPTLTLLLYFLWLLLYLFMVITYLSSLLYASATRYEEFSLFALPLSKLDINISSPWNSTLKLPTCIDFYAVSATFNHERWRTWYTCFALPSSFRFDYL